MSVLLKGLLLETLGTLIGSWAIDSSVCLLTSCFAKILYMLTKPVGLAYLPRCQHIEDRENLSGTSEHLRPAKTRNANSCILLRWISKP